jgi:hypothetical protein
MTPEQRYCNKCGYVGPDVHHNRPNGTNCPYISRDWQARAQMAQAAQEPDMLAVCAALGFDPTNHHNAAKCPYCRPPQAQPADEIARLRELADSEGTRAVAYLRRARKAEAELKRLQEADAAQPADPFTGTILQSTYHAAQPAEAQEPVVPPHIEALAQRLEQATEYMEAVKAKYGLQPQPAEAAQVVREQAEDEGLWFDACTAPEAYLQQELRRLHAAVERHHGIKGEQHE